MKKIYINGTMLLLFCITMQVFATKHVVHVGNFYFTPSSVNVAVGDTIRWVLDGGSHTTTSSTIPPGAANWDSPINSAVQFFEYKVTVAGVHNYVCTPHATMGQVGSFTASAASPTLSVTPSSRNVSAQAGSTTFNITSNSSWTASSNSSWCTVTSSGNGNGTLTANYSENTSVNARTALITITVSGIPSQTVSVIQSGAAVVLSVSPASQSVSSQSGTVQYSVSSNINWTVTSNAAWCTVSGNGSGNGSFQATYETNLTFQQRTAEITISGTGANPQVVTLVQDASTVGMENAENSQFTIYPNPTTGLFKIETTNKTDQEVSVIIFDGMGRKTAFESTTGSFPDHFNMESSPEGIYYIYLNSANGSSVQKLIIRRD